MSSRHFVSAYRNLVSSVRARALKSRDADAALSIGQLYGALRWLNYDGVYHDAEFEAALTAMVTRSPAFVRPDLSAHGGATVLVVSELYDRGGHSGVVMQWLATFRGREQHSLLMTRGADPGVLKKLNDSAIPFRVCGTSGVALVNEILEKSADAARVVLHIHPDDIAAAVAARILVEAGKTVFFYNHADHVFSFGISAASEVFEISQYGAEITRRSGRATSVRYIGIPIPTPAQAAQDQRVQPQQQKTVVSSGAAYKYESGTPSFAELIDRLLQRDPDLSVRLIGPGGDEACWAASRGQWGERVVFMGQIGRDDYAKVLQSATVYVDSFPITGGTAFPEALLCGKNVAGLTVPLQGYSPADELRVDNVDDLASRVIDVINEEPAALARIAQARHRSAQWHDLDAFRQRVEQAYRGLPDRASLPEAAPDPAWIENKWKEEQKVLLPFGARYDHYPLHFAVGFFFRIIRVLPYVDALPALKLSPAILAKSFLRRTGRNGLAHGGNA